MPDGVRISQYVPTWQAHPDTGSRRRSDYVARPAEIPWAHKKTPPSVSSTGSFFVGSSPVEFRDLSGVAPFRDEQPKPECIGGTRDGHPQYTGRFKHRQRR
jgi:hypothetical protein